MKSDKFFLWEYHYYIDIDNLTDSYRCQKWKKSDIDIEIWYYFITIDVDIARGQL